MAVAAAAAADEQRKQQTSGLLVVTQHARIFKSYRPSRSTVIISVNSIAMNSIGSSVSTGKNLWSQIESEVFLYEIGRDFIYIQLAVITKIRRVEISTHISIVT